MPKFVARYHNKIDYTVEAKHHDVARILARRYWVMRPELERDIAVIDIDEAGYGAHTGHEIGESVWAQVHQETLDKVHDIWCRRAGDRA